MEHPEFTLWEILLTAACACHSPGAVSIARCGAASSAQQAASRAGLVGGYDYKGRATPQRLTQRQGQAHKGAPCWGGAGDTKRKQLRD